MKIKKKEDEETLPLAIFFPKCCKKNPLREFPLDSVEICVICEQDHDTKNCPSLPGIKTIYQETSEGVEKLCIINQKQPWPN
jgi:hypothetical protein